MKRLLILGSTGFIGGHLLEHLRPDPSYELITPDRSTWDVNDPESLVTMLKEAKPDLVINLVSISSTIADRDVLYKINAFGNLNLLEALATTGFKGRLIYVSSSNIYGAVSDLKILEDIRPQPINHYSCAKLLAEYFCSMFSDKFDITIVRPFNIIGVGQKPSFLVSKFADHFARKALTIELGNLGVARDFVDVRDLCAMMMLVLKAGQSHSVINFANGQATQLADLFEAFVTKSGHRPEIVVNPKLVRHNDIFQQCGDNNRVRELGYCRQYSLEQTVSWIYNCVKNQTGN